jgi:hypothetical protein
MADTDETKSQRSILFSYDSVTGKGRDWLLALKSQSPTKSSKRSVLLLETNNDRGAQLKKMLSFYEIDVVHVPSFEKLRLSHESNKDKYRVCYLSEPPLHASGISWDKYCASLAPAERPLQIIATTSQNPVKRPHTSWMRMPFGLDQLVEQFEASFAQLNLLQTGGSSNVTPAGDMSVNMTFFADLVAIDELGAVIDSPFEFPLNCRINLTHPSLALIDLSKNLRVSATKKLDAAGTKFRSRITNQEGQVSIGRYWKPLFEKLESVKVEPTTQGPTPLASKGASGDAA